MIGHNFVRVAVVAAGVTLCGAFLMPAVSAAPVVPLGIDLGSSGTTPPSGPTPSGYGVYTKIDPDLSGLEVGTT
ncbi:hypothetical protein GCM10009722_16570 [Williamsia deligens]|nr:hypothetical protein [Williamsia deligens]